MNNDIIEATKLFLVAQERFNSVHKRASRLWWEYIELRFVATGNIVITAKNGRRIGHSRTFTKKTFNAENVKEFLDKLETLGYFKKENEND